MQNVFIAVSSAVKYPEKRDLPTWGGVTRLSLLFWNRKGGERFDSMVSPSEEQTFMAVRIRMKRVGAKNAPVFRIVVADSRSPRDGKFIEEIGTYHPLKKGENVSLDVERAQYWLGKGAQATDTVKSFLRKAARNAAPAPAQA
jgi:small subunit ribosomal protein S16